MARISARCGMRILLCVICALAVVAGGIGWYLIRAKQNSSPLVIAYAHEDGQQSVTTTQWAQRVAAACDCDIIWRDVTPNSIEAQHANGMYTPYNSDPELKDLAQPDVFVSFTPVTGRDAIARGQSDDYLNLRKYLKRMPNVTRYFQEVPQAFETAQQADGSILSIPGDAGEDYDGSTVHMFINRIWLNRLGLNVPATWVQLKDVLTAFRDGDPNGNGEHDEIPFAIRPTEDNNHEGTATFSNDGWQLLLNSTGMTTQLNEQAGQNLFAVEHAAIQDVATSDAVRRVGNYLADLASEGLVPRESFARSYALKRYNEAMANAAQGKTDTTLNPVPDVSATFVGTSFAEYESQLASATPLVGVAFAFDASAFAYNADQYESIPIPAEHDGIQPVWDRSGRARFNLTGVSVRAESRHRDDALQAVDALFDETISLAQFYGEDHIEMTHSDGRTTVNVYGDGTYPLGYGRSFVGWIRPGTIITGDKPRERYLAADKPYREIYRHMGSNGVLPMGMYAPLIGGTGIGSPTDEWLAEQVCNASADFDRAASWNAYVQSMTEGYDRADDARDWQKEYDQYMKRDQTLR